MTSLLYSYIWYQALSLHCSYKVFFNRQANVVQCVRTLVCYLSIVVVSRAVLLLHVLPTSREEGQRVEVLMWGLFAAGHQLALVEQIRCVAAASGSKLQSQHWLLHKGHSTGFILFDTDLTKLNPQ